MEWDSVEAPTSRYTDPQRHERRKETSFGSNLDFDTLTLHDRSSSNKSSDCRAGPYQPLCSSKQIEYRATSPGTPANFVKELSALHGMAGAHDEAPDGSEKCRERAERFSIKVRYRILLPLTGDNGVGARHRSRMRRPFLLQIVLIVTSDRADIPFLLPRGGAA
jgi:hypothetical protein